MAPEHDLLIDRVHLKLTAQLAHCPQPQEKIGIKKTTEFMDKSITNHGLYLCFECAAPLLKTTPPTPATKAVIRELRAIANHLQIQPTLRRVSAAKTRHYMTHWLPDAALLTGRDFQYTTPNARHPPPNGGWTCVGHTLPSSHHDNTAQAQTSMQTQNLEFTPKNFHLCAIHPLQYTSCIQYQQQYYAPQPFSVRDSVQLLSPLQGRPTAVTVGAQGVITKIDQHGTPTIQFTGHLLNCLPVDIPYLRKLPTTSIWIITRLAPSSKPPHNLVAFASPKYGDTTTHNTATITQEFDIHHIKSTIDKQTQPNLTPMPMPDTEDFAPDITCLSGFTPGPSPHDAQSTATKHAISALTSSLMTSRTDNGQQRTQHTQTTPTTTPITQPTRPVRPMPPRRTPSDNSHHQDQKMAEPMPPDTTALQQAGRACQNTSATNNSCLLHSVIAEVQRIQKTKTLAFTQQSETLRTEIARHMHQHHNLWLDNAPPSTTNLKAIPSTPLQQLQDRITSCATSGTYLGTDQLHIMATMLHPQGIRIVNYRFDSLCFDQLTLIHHLDYTNPHPNNALQTSLLNPQDIRPTDIVLCNAQPGRHWEACPPLTGSHPIPGDSFTGNDRVLFLPRHPPPNITGDNDRRQDTQTKSAKRKLVFHTQSPTLTDNPSSRTLLGSPV